VTADRANGEKSVEDDLHELGVPNVGIPRKSKPGKAAKPPRTVRRSAAP
jgi:transposase, IS5 family